MLLPTSRPLVVVVYCIVFTAVNTRLPCRKPDESVKSGHWLHTRTVPSTTSHYALSAFEVMLYSLLALYNLAMVG